MFRTFARLALYSYRGGTIWANWPAFIGSGLIAPGFTVAMIALTGRFARDEGAAQSYVAGMAFVGANFHMVAGLLQTYNSERVLGTLSLSITSSGSRLMTFLSRPTLHLPMGLIGIAASLVASRLILDADFSAANWGSIVAGYILICLSALSLGLLTSSFCLATRDYANYVSLTQALMLTLTGAVIPRDAMPAALETFTGFLPVSNGLVAVKEGFAGADISSVAGHLAAEAGIMVAYGVTGFFAYRFFERYATRTGEYEMS